MITMDNVQEISKAERLPLAQAEKRAYQYLVLYLCRDHDVIFKGGTLLDMVYSSGRFSEDVDLEGDPRVVDVIKKGLEEFGEDFTSRTERGKYLTKLILSMRGPLYDGDPRRMCRLRVDVNRRICIRKPLLKIVSPPFLPPFEIMTYDPLEVFADKLRILMINPDPRDLYDIFFLWIRLKKEKDPEEVMEEAKRIIEKKLKRTGEKLQFPLSQGIKIALSKWGRIKAYLRIKLRKEAVTVEMRDLYERF